MAKFRVHAQMVTDLYIDIEATKANIAYNWAYETADGGDFHNTGTGSWEMSISEVQELDEDADTDYVVSDDEAEEYDY